MIHIYFWDIVAEYDTYLFLGLSGCVWYIFIFGTEWLSMMHF